MVAIFRSLIKIFRFNLEILQPSHSNIKRNADPTKQSYLYNTMTNFFTHLETVFSNFVFLFCTTSSKSNINANSAKKTVNDHSRRSEQNLKTNISSWHWTSIYGNARWCIFNRYIPLKKQKNLAVNNLFRHTNHQLPLIKTARRIFVYLKIFCSVLQYSKKKKFLWFRRFIIEQQNFSNDWMVI